METIPGLGVALEVFRFSLPMRDGNLSNGLRSFAVCVVLAYL